MPSSDPIQVKHNVAPTKGVQLDVLDLFVETYGARTLRIICGLWAAAILVTSTLRYLGNDTFATVPLLTGFVMFAIVLELLRRQHFRAALLTFIWGAIFATCVNAIWVAGLQSPGLLGLPVLAMLGSWLLGVRQVFPMLILMGTYLIATAWAQTAGLLPTAEPRSQSIWAIAYLTACAIGATFGMAMTRTVREQLARAHALSADLREANAHLEDKVAERTAELSATLERLKKTQNELIQAEKLASLGAMVAGVAHELNTPIGNAILTVDTLRQRAQALNTALHEDKLKKSDLVSGLGSMVDMSKLIDQSVQRAATLITSFKQVAVDQVSERRRVFDLHTVVDENLAALRPGMQKKAWVFENLVPPNIECDGFPGPLGQVLTNLVQNAIIHGFDGRDAGTVRISATIDDQHVELVVSDDGVGMSAATSMHAFEPFFTTKLGKGGSGLGLAICYRIVTTILAGEIRVASSPGTGTQFTMRMPRRAPGAI